MAKDSYYEMEGSSYLNSRASVSKEGVGQIPEHDHDGRYYTKEETENTQRSIDERFRTVDEYLVSNNQQFTNINDHFVEVDRQLANQGQELENKAPLQHTHTDATTNKSGFMSANDKKKLDSMTTPVPETKTNIHAYCSYVQTLTANTANKIMFDSLAIDDNNEFSLTKSEVTIKNNGVYLINGIVETGSNTLTGNLRLFLQVFINGVLDNTVGTAFFPGGVMGGVNGSTILNLRAGDKLTFYVWSNVTVNTRGRGSINEYIQIVRLW